MRLCWIGETERYEMMSRQFAEELGLQHVNRPCGTTNLARFLDRARELAHSKAADRQ